MAEARFPVFAAGQTLTKDDLNLLRAFVDGQDRLLGRLAGFGISCGLAGEISGTDLRIGVGLAVDQAGEAMMLDAPFVAPAGTAPGSQTFDFIDPAPGGVTPVLVLTETLEAAPECDEEGCEAHASTGVRTAEVILVAGRLRPSRTDFATEPLLARTPLTITLSGTVQGDFLALRTAIVDRLAAAGVTLAADVLTRLNGLTLPTSLLPAIRMYRAAFLNQVFFAALDLLRCMALHAGPCLRDEPRPGVALGWLHNPGGGPQWDCRYRHHFEPPAGLVSALSGGGCADPCDLLRNRFEALVRSYAEPAVPAPADPPTPPPDPGDFHICPYGATRLAERDLYLGVMIDCPIIVFPPAEIPPHWVDVYAVPEELIPGFGVVDPPPPDLLYGIDPIDFAQAGVLSLKPALGATAAGTATVLEGVLAGQGVTPDVQVLTQAEAAALPGFAPQDAVSVGDTIVLVHDSQNKIVSTGRVPNQQVLKSAGAAVAQATGAAQSALGAAEEARGVATSAAAEVAGLADQVLGFSDDLGGVRGDVQGALIRLDSLGQSLDGVNLRLDGLAQRGDELSMIISRTGDEVRGRMDTVFERLSLVEGATTRLDRDMGGALEQVSRFDARIDEVYKVQFGAAMPGFTEPTLLAAGTAGSLATFFGAVRESVTAAAAEDDRPAVRDALAGGDAALATLTELSRRSAGAGAAAVAPGGPAGPAGVAGPAGDVGPAGAAGPGAMAAPVAELVRSLVEALGRAGIDDDALAPVRRAAEDLLARLEQPE